MDELEFLRAALRQLMRSNPFRRFNAHGVDIGPKIVGGAPIGPMAIRFYVACKLPASKVPRSRQVPTTLRFVLPADGVERVAQTDVIEAPQGELLELPPGALHRPVPGGVRVQIPAIGSSGTLGGWVWDRTDDSIVFLSNEHVLGAASGSTVYQPSSSDPDNRIGVVKRSGMITPGPDPETPADCYNFVDAAIGAVDTSENFDLRVLEVGPGVYAIEGAAIDMPVEKFGQVTQLTRGRVTSVDYNSSFDFPGLGEVVLCDLIRIVPEEGAEPWSSQGDSGSIVFRQESESVIKPAVGLAFAGGGSGASNWGAACKIQRVFSILDLDVLCAGGFAAFLDALFADDAADAGADAVASLFQPARSRRWAGARFHSGLARAVQTRLRRSKRGAELAALVDRHRAELLMLLLRDGDVRRATIAALRPVLRGASTTDAVFQRRLAAEDVARLTDLSQVVARQASKELRAEVAALMPILRGAAGRRIDELFEGTGTPPAPRRGGA